MREILIGKKQIMDRQYRYYLLAETGENDCEYYGVKITDGREDAALRNITVSQRNIQFLGALLVDFSVTPMTLRDVVEDWLARN